MVLVDIFVDILTYDLDLQMTLNFTFQVNKYTWVIGTSRNLLPFLMTLTFIDIADLCFGQKA